MAQLSKNAGIVCNGGESGKGGEEGRERARTAIRTKDSEGRKRTSARARTDPRVMQSPSTRVRVPRLAGPYASRFIPTELGSEGALVFSSCPVSSCHSLVFLAHTGSFSPACSPGNTYMIQSTKRSLLQQVQVRDRHCARSIQLNELWTVCLEGEALEWR